MNEKDFSTQIEDLLAIGGWDRWIHLRPARVKRRGKDIYETAYSGHKGFLDYLAMRTLTKETIWFELKGDGGKVTPEQRDWLAAHKAVGNRAYVWWPKDYQDAQDVLLAGCDFDFSHVKEDRRLL